MENNHKIIIALLCIIIIMLIISIATFSPLLIKEDTNLTISNKKIETGDPLIISLTDHHGNPIKNGTVHIKLKDEEGIIIDENIKTNSKGKAKFKMEEKGKYSVECNFDENKHFKSSYTNGNLTVKKPTTKAVSDKKTNGQNSNSGLSEDGYSYYPEYGPDVDFRGITREYAIEHNYHYLPQTIDGKDRGAYIPYDPANGCYHV